MDPIGKPIEHNKIIIFGNHDDIKPATAKTDSTSPSPEKMSSDTVAGRLDSDAIAKLMEDMKGLTWDIQPGTSGPGNHGTGLNPLSIYPAPGGGLFTSCLMSGMEPYGVDRPLFSKPAEAPMDLSAPPAFLADSVAAEKTPASAPEKNGQGSVPADSAYGRNLRETGKREVCSSIPSIFGKLAEKEITRKECMSLLEELSAKVDLSGDSASSMLFRRFLGDIAYGVPSQSVKNAEKPAAEDGETAGNLCGLAALNPSLYVKYFGGLDGRWCGPLSLAKGDDIAKYLVDVRNRTASGPIDHETLRSVAHLAKEAKDKSSAEDITNRDSSISFKDIARGSVYLINEWWKSGRIEIMQDGRPLKPDEADLGKALTAENAAVKGTTIDLGRSAPVKASAEVSALTAGFRAIGTSFVNDSSDKALAECRKAAETSPDLASEALDAYLDESRSASKSSWSIISNGMGSLMERCVSQPWLKELVTGRMDRIKGFTAEAEAKNILAEDNAKSLVGLYGGIAKGIPEAVDGSFMAESVVPLLLCRYKDSMGNSRDDAVKLVKSIWKNDPGMVKPTIDAILNDRESLSIDGSVWDMIRMGARKYGWQPGREQLEQIAGRLSCFAPASRSSLFDISSKERDFAGAVGVLRVLKDRNPEILKGLTMPDTDGNIVPLEQGIADRVISDPKAGNSLERVMIKDGDTDRFNFMNSFYPLISSDREARDFLARTVSGEYGKDGSLDGMTRRGRAALAVLAHTGPEKWHAPEAQAVLSNELLKRQSSMELDRIVGYGRDDEKSKILAGISGGKLSVGEAFTEAQKVISLGFASLRPDVALEPWLGKMRDAMKTAAADPGFAAYRDSMLSEIESKCSGGCAVGNLPVEDIKKLYLLLVLAGGDDALLGRLDRIMAPVMQSDRSRTFTRTANDVESRACLSQYTRLLIEKNIELMKSGGLPPYERPALDSENFRNKLGFETTIERAFDDRSRDALLEGAARDYSSPEMERFMSYFNDDGEKRWAFTVIARTAGKGEEIPSEAGRLLSILEGMPDRESPAVQGWSSTYDEDGETVTTPLVSPEKKMKKDLGKALSAYVEQRVDDIWKGFENAGMTRSERASLMKRSQGCHTSMSNGSPSGEITQRAYSCFCRNLSSADPATGITDLPASFRSPQTAYKVYMTLAPGAERDEEIGPEWQRFKAILEAMGGDENLGRAIEAYGFAKKMEGEGYEWGKVVEHIYMHSSLGQDYREAPIREQSEITTSGTVEEFEDELFIDGLRLSKNV